MSNPADRFVTNRMSNSTDLGDVDDGVNNLEAAIRAVFGLPADTAVTPMSVASDGKVNMTSGLGIGSSPQASTIVSTIPPDSGNENELANVQAIRDFVLNFGGGSGLSFTPAQRYGSLWVSSHATAPVLAVGPPAYWQIVARSQSGEGYNDFNVPSAASYEDFMPIQWLYTLYEHPLLTENTALRPCKTHLGPIPSEDIQFPMIGLWYVDAIVEALNYNGGVWNPPAASDWTIPYMTPCWTLQLYNEDSTAIITECRSPQIITSRHKHAAQPNKVVYYLDEDTGNGSIAYDDPAMFLHTLEIHRAFYVDDVDDVYQLRLQQMSGDVIPVGQHAFRAVFRYIPTNGG